MTAWNVTVYAEYAPEAVASPAVISHTRLTVVLGATLIFESTFNSQEEAMAGLGGLVDGTYTATLQCEDSLNNVIGTPLVKTLVLPSATYTITPSNMRFSVQSS